jgi:hypothetical protein
VSTRPRPTTVLYVVGTHRGGTTITGRLIGALRGAAFVGEVHRLIDQALPYNQRCGCGREHDRCPVWSRVVPEILDLAPLPTLKSWLRDVSPMTGTASAARRLDRRLRSGDRPPYADVLAQLYSSLASVVNARVLVDTSKLPADARLLAHLNTVDGRLLHVVRDPRGMAASSLRRQSTKRSASVVFRSGVFWSRRHSAALRVSKHFERSRTLVIRYEDIVSHTQATLTTIASFLGLEAPPVSLVSVNGEVALPEAHTPGGNGRFRGTNVTVEPDERWHARLSTSDRAVLATTTALVSSRVNKALRTQGTRLTRQNGLR